MLRLLIVDDEQIIREALSHMVDYHTLGYDLIGTAKNGMEAYDIICDEYPDVVITDIRMPVVDGLTLIEKAGKTDAHIEFVLLSGYGEFEYAKRAMGDGVKYYLLKPTKKSELISALQKIQADLSSKQLLKKELLDENLKKLQFPLEQCFLLESLASPKSFEQIFNKYRKWQIFPTAASTICYCYFVESAYAGHFIENAFYALGSLHIKAAFPIIYVKNTVIIIMETETLFLQEHLEKELLSHNYEEQSTSFKIAFDNVSTSQELFKIVTGKISRFEHIMLYPDVKSEACEIKNTPASPDKIQNFYRRLKESNASDFDLVFNEIFPDVKKLEDIRPFALSLFLTLMSETELGTEYTDDMIHRIYDCASLSEIKQLLKTIFYRTYDTAQKKSNHIKALKQYVRDHLDSENLSLKWIAENYLYVNVGYLSKRFVKEEGIRFSEYLNKLRMEEAIHLITFYHDDNIKDIAKKVGFGNNPRYFSQVFKKYTGTAPSGFVTVHSANSNLHKSISNHLR